VLLPLEKHSVLLPFEEIEDESFPLVKQKNRYRTGILNTSLHSESLLLALYLLLGQLSAY
jgi:hypothetical protein